MILPDFKGFPRTGRILGVDWGLARIGVAVSDATREFVFTRPVVTVPRGATNHADVVAQIAGDECVIGIVVGLPVRNDGSESDTTKMVRDFVGALSDKTDAISVEPSVLYIVRSLVTERFFMSFSEFLVSESNKSFSSFSHVSSVYIFCVTV
mgnify:CR=1 FL=1